MVENPDYISRSIPVLKEIIAELSASIAKGEHARVLALTDAAHNFPEMLTKSDTWKPADYWKKDLEPYRRKWDKSFLNEWRGHFR